MKCETVNVNHEHISQVILYILLWIYFAPCVCLIHATWVMDRRGGGLVFKIGPWSFLISFSQAANLLGLIYLVMLVCTERVVRGHLSNYRGWDSITSKTLDVPTSALPHGGRSGWGIQMLLLSQRELSKWDWIKSTQNQRLFRFIWVYS